MKLKISNLNRPSNKRYKAVADFFLYTLPLYLIAMKALPFDEGLKSWIEFGLTMIIVTFKGLTKFTGEEDNT